MKKREKQLWHLCQPSNALRVLAIGALLWGKVSLASAQHQKISVKYQNVSAVQVIDNVIKKTGIYCVYNAELLRNMKVTAEARNEDVSSFLSRIFSGKKLEVVWHGNTVIIRKKGNNAPMVMVSGRIVDGNNEPLPGVSVSLVGGKEKAVSNADGYYQISAHIQDAIRFAFIGMKTKTVIVSKQLQNITLEEDVHKMNDVVVTGYQTIDRSKLTSAVTTLKMDDINNPGKTTIDQMLEGKVPGMIFMKNSGQIGAVPKLRIRGTSTILGNREPLWVLDGIVLSDPVNVDPQQINDPDFVNLLGNAIAGLNPNDIEQIDVLKDASATALYGAKAGNGVIVITTKKGKIGRPSITYTGNFTYTPRPRYSDKDVYMMNSEERMDVSKELVDRKMYYNSVTQWSGYEEAILDYYNGKLTYDEFKAKSDYYKNVNTDWLGLLTHDAFSHNHSISISGGAPTLKYYASMGYSKEDGVINKEEGERYSAMLNLSTNYRKLNASFQLMANHYDRHYNPSDLGVMNYAYNMSRTMPAYNADGSLFYYPRTNTTSQLYEYNIINEMNNSGDDTSTDAINLRVQARYDILPCLNIDGLFAYAISDTNHETYYTKDTYYVFGLRADQTARWDQCPVGGEMKREDTRNHNYTLRLQANFMKGLGHQANHLLTASAGLEIKSNEYKGFSITRRGYFPEFGGYFDYVPTSYSGYYAQFMSSSAALGTYSRQLTNEVAWYATAGYGYKDTYIFNVHLRNERSNLFGSRANEEFSPIWAVSGRWNMKKDVLKKVKWVDDAALRLSWGWQGNMLPGQTARMIIQQAKITDPTFNESYATISKYPNPDLKWEKTNSFNVGLDFALLSNKIRGSFAYFYKRTSDAFLTKTISEINGIRQYVVNGGVLQNQGVELSLSFTPIDHANIGGKGRGFVWRFDPQIGEVLNKVINRAINNKTHVLRDEITYNDFLSGDIELSNKPISTFYSYKFKGLSSKDGSPIFYGCEDEKKEEYMKEYGSMANKEDVYMAVMTESGQREPYIQGSFNNYFGYRNFGLSFDFSYSIGNKIRLLKICSGYASNCIYPQQNLRKEFVYRWRKPGDEAYTNIPGLVTSTSASTPWWNQYPASQYSFGGTVYDMYDNSDIRVVSGDYLKLQTISFRYNLEEKWAHKMGLQSIYISLVGNNLFTICSSKLHGQDPTMSGSTPNINLSTRPSYTFNINVTL